jgi:hypothetical protein
MTSIEIMRDFVRNMYGKPWQQKVDRMADNQVMAIYMRQKQIPNVKDAKRALKKTDPPPF